MGGQGRCEESTATPISDSLPCQHYVHGQFVTSRKSWNQKKREVQVNVGIINIAGYNKSIMLGTIAPN